MKQLIILILYSVLSALPMKAQEQQEVPFTLADRDRIMRTEVRLEVLESKMDAKFTAADAKMDAKFAAVDAKINATNLRIDSLFWILGTLVALNLFMFGYMIWDRHTAIKPAMDKAEAAELLSSTNTRVLRDFSKDQPKLAEILKFHGLL